MKSIARKLRGQYFKKAVIYFLTWCLVLNTSLPAVLATPVGGTFTVGTGTIAYGTNTAVTVNQAQSVVQWGAPGTGGINTSATESLTFLQAGSLRNSAVLNRIMSGNPTQFDGTLNGLDMRIFIVNPAGIVFGAGSQVNVAQLVASGLRMSDTDFANAIGNPTQKMVFTSTSNSNRDKVENNGTITAANSVYLVGENVTNNGAILCPGGLVVMAAGDNLRLGQPGSSVIVDISAISTDLRADSGNDVQNNGTIGHAGSPVGKLVLAAGDAFSQAITNVENLAVVANENVTFNGDIDIAGSVNVRGGQNPGSDAAIDVHGNITAADIRLKNGADKGSGAVGEKTYSPIVVDDAKNLTATAGDVVVEAVHDIYLGGDVQASGSIYLNADEDSHGDPREPGYSAYPYGGGDVIARGALTAGGDVDIFGNAIRFEADVTATNGDLTITGRTSADPAGNTLINSGRWGVIQTAEGTTLSAGRNVSVIDGGGGPEDPVAPGTMMLTGEESLAIVAGAADGIDDGQIILENVSLGVVGATSLTLEQDLDLNLGDEQWDLFNQGETDLTLISNNGSVTAVETGGHPKNAADQWASVGAAADNGITLSGDQGDITTRQLTSTTGDIGVHAKAGQLLATEAIEATAGSVNLTADGGIDADGNITAGTDVHLNNNTVAADGVTLSAGQDVIVGDGTGDGTTLTGEGALTVEAGRDIVLGGAVDTVGDLALTADTGEADGGDMTAYGSLTSGGSLYAEAADDIAITDASALENMTLFAHGSDSGVTVNGALATTNGDIDVSSTYFIELYGPAEAGGNLMMSAQGGDSGDSYVYAEDMLSSLTGSTQIVADQGIELDGPVNAYGDLTLDADIDDNGSSELYAYSTLTSQTGSVYVSSSDSTQYLYDDVTAALDIVLDNSTYASGDLLAGRDVTIHSDLTLDGGDWVLTDGVWSWQDGDQSITASTGTITAESWIWKETPGELHIYGGDSELAIDLQYPGEIDDEEAAVATAGNLYMAGNGDIQVSGDVTALGGNYWGGPDWPEMEEGQNIIEPAEVGGVSIISENGKIYTEDGIDSDTINVVIEGYSDYLEGIGVDLPHGDGKAAIVLMSNDDLKVGEDAELRVEGFYDAAAVDDRAGVDFLVDSADSDPPGRNPGTPIDVAIYLASAAANVHVGSAVSIESEGTGAIVVDAYDTVSFGSLFEDSLAGIGWLEVCSRRTGSLNEAVYLGTLPYADGSGPEEGYVLRGEKPDAGTGAWVLDAILPLVLPDFAETPKGVSVGVEVLANDDTGEFPPVTVTLDSPTSEHGGTVTVNPDGTVTYEPPADLSGLTFDQSGEATDTFTYSITDAGEVTSETATVTITLINMLPDPVNDAAMTQQDAPIVIDVLSNDSDPDADLLGVSSFAYEGAGTVVLNEDGTFTYTPASGFVGEDDFTYSVTDGLNSASGMVTITVNPQPAPLHIPAAPGLERVEFEISGCPALMAWTAAELGITEGRIQIQIAHALASGMAIQPCDACAGLKQAATVLQDAQGTHIAALAQVISQFAPSTAPPTEEQMTSIANAIALNVGGDNQYAAAGEYLDALAKYVGILNSEMGFSAEQSIQLATDKYVGPLADGQNVGVAAYVAARLAALGGS